LILKAQKHALDVGLMPLQPSVFHIDNQKPIRY